MGRCVICELIVITYCSEPIICVQCNAALWHVHKWTPLPVIRILCNTIKEFDGNLCE